MKNTLKVATWNIGSLYADYAVNWPYLQQMLRSQTVDVLCMQEVPHEEELLQAICDVGGFSYSLFQITSISHIHKGHDMGVAVFSRFPIKALQTIHLDKPTVPIAYQGKTEVWHDKYFLAFVCHLAEQKVAMVTGHGFPFHRYGLENEGNYGIIQPSFVQLDKWVEELPDDTRLLCMAADFNLATPLRFMPYCRQHFRDVFQDEATRPSGRKTDAVLIPHGVRAVEKTNILPPWKHATADNPRGIFDHNFIAAELQW